MYTTLKYFQPSEFNCKCGCGTGADLMDPDMLLMLDKARALAGIPFSINSAYRCPKHNAAEGGVSGSAHTKGNAVDISCDGSANRYAIIKALIDAGFKRIGVAKSFVHADNDPDKVGKVVWLY